MFTKSKTDGNAPEGAGKLRLILILAGAALGILLLLLGSGDFFSDPDESTSQPTQPSPQEELE